MSNSIFLSTVSSGGGGGGGVVNTTYNDLVNLITANNLVVGTIYEFNYLLKFNLIGTAGEFTALNSEVIQVLATETYNLSKQAYSVTYNENIIYDINNINSFNVSTVNSTGYISCRYCDGENNSSFINYKVNFDFRNQFFLKYVTATNVTGFTNIDNATVPIIFNSIQYCVNSTVGFCQNVEFVNLLNSTYSENNNFNFEYSKVDLIYSYVSIKQSSFFELECVYSELNNVLLDNAKLNYTERTTINDSQIQNTIINTFTYNSISNTVITNSQIDTLNGCNISNLVINNSTITDLTNSNIQHSSIFNFNCNTVTLFLENTGLDNFANNIYLKAYGSTISNVLSCETLQNNHFAEINNCLIDFFNNDIVNVGNNNTYQYLIESNLIKVLFAYSSVINAVVNAFYIPNCLLSKTITYPITAVAGLGANYQAGTDALQSNTALNINEGVVLTQGYNQLNGTVIAQPLTNIPAGQLKGKTITANSNNTIYQYFEFLIKNSF